MAQQQEDPWAVAKTEPIPAHDEWAVADTAKLAPSRQQDFINKQQGEHGTPLSVSDLTQWLPAVGGVVGGALGLTGGPVGAVAGAAGGGVAGESFRQNINRLAGENAPNTMTEAMRKMAVQGAIQGGTEVVGGVLIPKVAAKLAPGLMQSALKPGVKNMARVISGKEPVPRVVQTLLDEGVNVTPGGLKKVTKLLSSTNDEIADVIKNTSGWVYPEAVAARADDVTAKFMNQVAPTKDLAPIREVAEDFMAVHGGPARPATPLTMEQAQTLKKGTYQSIGDRAYLAQQGPGVEAEKALARGLKEDIETAAAKAGKDIKALNQRDSRLIEAQEAIGKRVALAANGNPAGLAFLTHNPSMFMAYVLTRSPMAKSLVARGLYKSASRVTKIPENLIRLGITAMASHDEGVDR